MTKVVVLLTTRDRPRLLAEALRCALGQRVRGAEIAVVVAEDGPQPANDAVLEACAGDAVLRATLPPSPGEAAPVRHLGAVAAARLDPEWIAYLDDDDVWLADHLARLLGAARASGAKRPFVFARPVHVGADGTCTQPVVPVGPNTPAEVLAPLAPVFVMHRCADLDAVDGWPVDDRPMTAHARLWSNLVDSGCSPVLSLPVTAMHLPARLRQGRSDVERARESAACLEASEGMGLRLDAELYTRSWSVDVDIEEVARPYREAVAAAEVARDQARADLDTLQATRWWRLHERLAPWARHLHLARRT